MSVDAMIMLLGAFVALLPFLGFPGSWEDVFYFSSGVLIIALGIAVRRQVNSWRRGKRPVRRPRREVESAHFVDNVPEEEPARDVAQPNAAQEDEGETLVR